MNSNSGRKQSKVIVADDHPLYLKALTETIKKSEFVSQVEQAKNGVEVLNLLKQSKYDLVFLDVSMPEMDGEEAAYQISLNYPDVKIIAVSMHETSATIKQMHMAGCKSYILKAADEKEILFAIKNVIAGKNYFNQLVTEKLLLSNEEETSVQFHLNFRLMPKEIKITKLVCQGKTSKEIAAEMNLSPRTIDTYRDNLFKKLLIKTRTGLALFAIRNKLIEI